MPALPKKLAAEALGISPATLLRRTRDGVGVLRRGRGRGVQTLFDVELLRTKWGGSGGVAGETLTQLDRGVRATTLPESLSDCLLWIKRTGVLAEFDVPIHRREALLRFIEQQIVSRAREHMRLDGK
jgi:hypothetical protein